MNRTAKTRIKVTYRRYDIDRMRNIIHFLKINCVVAVYVLSAIYSFSKGSMRTTAADAENPTEMLSEIPTMTMMEVIPEENFVLAVNEEIEYNVLEIHYEVGNDGEEVYDVQSSSNSVEEEEINTEEINTEKEVTEDGTSELERGEDNNSGDETGTEEEEITESNEPDSDNEPTETVVEQELIPESEEPIETEEETETTPNEELVVLNIYRCPITGNDLDVLYRIVEAEVTGDSGSHHNITDDELKQAKRHVADVIINRVNKGGQYGNSISSVVFKSGQFQPISDGRYYSVNISQMTIDACTEALEGSDTTGGALYFRSDGGTWGKQVILKDAVGHAFFK